MGRKAIQINKDQFEDLLELQCTKEDVAGFFHCSHDTIERFCRKTYGDTFLHVSEQYKSIGRVSLRRSQFAMAQTNAQMAIHLGKQYLGQTDKTETKVTTDINVKRGTISKVVYYDRETGKTTREEITGKETDVDAYIENRDTYNGDQIEFMIPSKDPDPDEVTGEKIKIGHKGDTLVKLHLPWNKRDNPSIKIRDGETGAEICFPDDGRGGYVTPQTGS